jgi:hypothetical protein
MNRQSRFLFAGFANKTYRSFTQLRREFSSFWHDSTLSWISSLHQLRAIQIDEAGFVTVWPCGQTMPTASNLNLTAGLTTPNLVISKIGDSGKICIYTQNPAHLIPDIAGYMP